MDNRTKILSVALKLFSSNGYEGVGIQEIVKAADITKPTMYHYFGSKKGLLEALLATYFKPFIKSLQTASAYNSDLPATLKSITQTFFAFASENKLFYRMQLSMCFAPPESEPYILISIYNKQIISLLEEMFVKAAANHGNMKERQKRYAFTFLGIINNYITLFLSGNLKLDDTSVYNAVHQFSHGIYS